MSVALLTGDQRVYQEGSEFSFTLVLGYDENKCPMNEHTGDSAILDGARVLIIDDMLQAADICKHYMMEKGAVVDVVDSCIAALPVLVTAAEENNTYDIVVIDSALDALHIQLVSEAVQTCTNGAHMLAIAPSPEETSNTSIHVAGF